MTSCWAHRCAPLSPAGRSRPSRATAFTHTKSPQGKAHQISRVILPLVPFLHPERCFQPRQLGGPSRRIRRYHAQLMKLLIITFAFITLALCGSTSMRAAGKTQPPSVRTPPASFFQLVRERDRDTARRFYKKYIDVKGMPVVASAEVADQALQRTYDIVTHLLAGRLDFIGAMVSNGMYLIIIGRNQVYTDMPEYRNHPNPAYQNERVRGTGGKPTSFGEENLLSLPIDRYDDESIGVHEFCHTIDSTLRSIDPTWEERRAAAWQNVREKGLWYQVYAGSNPGEYWGEIVQ